MANPHLDLLLQLMGGAKQRLGARPSMELNEYIHRRTNPTLAQNPVPETLPGGPMTNVLPGPGSNPPISQDPFFEQMMRSENPAFDDIMTSDYVGDPKRTFDELQPDELPRSSAGQAAATTNEPTLGGAEWAKQRQTLVADVMRAVGIQPGGTHDSYFQQLKNVDDGFINRLTQKLGLNEDIAINPDTARLLLANEFEAFGQGQGRKPSFDPEFGVVNSAPSGTTPIRPGAINWPSLKRQFGMPERGDGRAYQNWLANQDINTITQVRSALGYEVKEDPNFPPMLNDLRQIAMRLSLEE